MSFGMVYHINPGQEKNPDITRKYTEQKKLAIFVSGMQEPEAGTILNESRLSVS
jgi:hypothetical protein